MATIVNEKDVILQAAGSRTVTTSLPSNVQVTYLEITGAKPPINATATSFNYCHPRYSIFNESAVPPLLLNSTVSSSLDSAVSKFSGKSLKLAATGADGYAYCGASATDYNIDIPSNESWILSGYVYCSGTSKAGQFYIKTSAAGTLYPVSFTTGGTANTWERFSAVLDLTADASLTAIIRLDNDAGNTFNMWFDGIMLEVQANGITDPSAFLVPALTEGAVTSDYIADDAVTTIKIFDDAITAAKVNLAAIDALGDLATGTVDTAQIVNNAVESLQLLDGAVSAAKTTINAIDSTTGNLVANSVDAVQIVAGSVTSVEIDANTITANNIAGLTITASEMAANSITSTKIDVATLSAITADIGTITAGSVETTGYVRAFGSSSQALGLASIYGNENNTADLGVAGESGTTSGNSGVIGAAAAASTIGVKGENGNHTNGTAVYGLSTGSTGTALHGSALTSGTALNLANGVMKTNNSTKVLNLNAALLDGNGASDFHKTATTSLTIPNQSATEGGEVALQAAGTAYDVYIDTIGNVVADTEWRVHWNSTTQVSVDNSGDMTIAGTVYNTSDESVKTNLEVIKNPLEKINKVSGYTFDRTDKEKERETGVIAQEIIKILPEAVSERKDGLLSVSYGNMVGLLIEAIKELNDKIETLEMENAKS